MNKRTSLFVVPLVVIAAATLVAWSQDSRAPNGLMNLAYIGALFLAAAVLSLGVGLIRAARRMEG